MKAQQPAFPRGVVFPENLGMAIKSLRDINSGMTLRQYYAAKAMQAIIIHQRHVEPLGSSPPIAKIVAKMAYDYSDAMIAFEEEEGKK